MPTFKREPCLCCEEIEIWQEHIKREKIDNIVESKIFAKLSIYTWRKGEKKIKGNQSGTITTKAHTLKYCPSCGKKIGGIKQNDRFYM